MTPPTQKIALFLQGSIKMLMSGQKKGKKVLPYFVRKYALYTITIKSNSKSLHILLDLVLNFCSKSKGRPFFFGEHHDFWGKIGKNKDEIEVKTLFFFLENTTILGEKLKNNNLFYD